VCSYEQWETLAHRFQEGFEEGQLRQFLADAVDRVEALLDELTCCACARENRDWASGRGRRTRPEWIA
jgi:hypothetical protein